MMKSIIDSNIGRTEIGSLELKSIFDEKEIRIMGRTAAGVRGINMPDGECICAEVCDLDANVLIVTEKGYGKRTFVREFRETKRGSKGVKALNITEKNGRIASFNIVDDEKDIIIITDAGMVIRLATTTVSQLSRIAQGVRLINLKENQLVTSISVVDKESERVDEDINDGKSNLTESNDNSEASDNQDGESIVEQ